MAAAVDRLLVGYAPAVVLVGSIVALFEIAGFLPQRAGLGLDLVAGIIGGSWCSLNFWRCRHAHCVVTGGGWLAFSVLVLIEVVIGHSLIQGYEQPAFIAILGAGLLFEAGWYARRRTNAVLSVERRPPSR